MKKERKITIALLVIYLLILSWIILFKLQFSFSTLDHIRQINLIPFSDSVIANGRIDFDEIINNVIVFIPVGVYFSLLFRNKSFLKVIGSVLSISLAYETIQFIFAIGASDI
ncbi:VanZ family protein, partial [Clostridium perfringens]